MKGIVGRKLGMTQVFTEKGVLLPVTVIEAQPGCVIQIKSKGRDGYEAVKVGFFEQKKDKNVTMPMKGIFKKTGQKAYKLLREFPFEGVKVGDQITVAQFEKGEKVAVSGTSKGKGFQGVMKRLNYSGGPGSHGSMFNRAPGSIGASSYPSRVWKGKGLPGHMGDVTVTTRNLKIVEVRAEQNLILINGAVPGATGGIVVIRKDD